MTQTWALLFDAYRELNARKMFWITLILSGLAVSVLLLVGITEDGNLKLLIWTTPFPAPPGFGLVDLLKGTFVSFGIGFWLAWGATILALISTASIIPEFVQSGAIDLALAKPIGRVRLFLTKYVGGLLFVALQVGVFSLAAFLIIGLRTGTWEAGFFLAIPIVVIFFSYLASVSALVGLVTRSTVAALLLTALFWVGLFALNSVDEVLVMPRVANEAYIEKLEEQLNDMRSSPDEADASQVSDLEVKLEEARDDFSTWRKWHTLVFNVKTVLPKTSETVGLLKRWLTKAANLPESDEERFGDFPFINREMWKAGVRMRDIVERTDTVYRSRSVFWILATSLIFEGLIVSIACLIFARRDF